ncbi:hypothetical protein ANN_05269 [Periplaneta americana]|uniref:DUF659 domain-containing protein n=1 Tax=Periplaneta americana TaxID=6978 RepID=A0ABQ8TD67_PERAM|nr:hypothetical protein ANN_05269 [Periplaneta americana]
MHTLFDTIMNTTHYNRKPEDSVGTQQNLANEENSIKTNQSGSDSEWILERKIVIGHYASIVYNYCSSPTSDPDGIRESDVDSSASAMIKTCPILRGYPKPLKSLYRRPYGTTVSLYRPPWNVAKRRWMASATSTRGGPTRGRSFASDRQGGLGRSCRSRNGICISVDCRDRSSGSHVVGPVRVGDLWYATYSISSADKNPIKHTTMRVLLFQIIAPGIPLPPQPVLTRWGTWLDAVNYYAEYYGKIMEVIDALDSTDSSAVAAVKSLPSEQLLEDILFIDSNFKIVSKSIILLESSKLQLSEALNIVYKVSQTVIQNNNSLISEKVKCELRNIIAKNSTYSQLRIINDVLSGHDKTAEVRVLKSSEFPFFKYAPITSCDVERTFSQYKNCLSDHRRRFTLQSIKMYVTLHCNAHIQG